MSSSSEEDTAEIAPECRCCWLPMKTFYYLRSAHVSPYAFLTRSFRYVTVYLGNRKNVLLALLSTASIRAESHREFLISEELGPESSSLEKSTLSMIAVKRRGDRESNPRSAISRISRHHVAPPLMVLFSHMSVSWHQSHEFSE